MTTAIESAYAKETAATSCPCKKKRKKKKRINERMFNMDGIDWHMVASSQLLVD
jgi:hypothetical protein